LPSCPATLTNPIDTLTFPSLTGIPLASIPVLFTFKIINMKKIFTLLVSVGLLTAAANAQPGSRDNRDKPQYDQKTGQQNRPKDDHQYDQKTDQQNGQWDKDNSYSNDDRYNKSNDSYGKGVQMQVNQINRKYDLKVQQVQNNFRMKRFEKTRMLRSLEAQRQQEIKMLYARSGNRTLYDRGYNSNH
jgi:hypothetical protein